MSKKAKDLVEITCYGQTETMERKKAIQFYTECAEWSDGCEKERYCNILCDLLSGRKVARDI